MKLEGWKPADLTSFLTPTPYPVCWTCVSWLPLALVGGIGFVVGACLGIIIMGLLTASVDAIARLEER